MRRGSTTLERVFELHDVSLLVAAKPQELVLLGDVSAVFTPGELVAVVGTPGSGKSTLLHLLAGIRQPTFGQVVWTDENGRPARPRPPIAYLPQRAHACEPHFFSAIEQVEMALRLRVAGGSRNERRQQAAAWLEKTGLGSLADCRPDALTASQRRRLELAVELAGSPALLLCDESPSGFDPKTDTEFAQLLRACACDESLAAVHVTHALGDLESYDSVIVLHGGQLAYQGPPEFLAHYFALDSALDLYEQLATRRPDDWHRSWVKHGVAYRTAEGQKQLAAEIGETHGTLHRKNRREPAEIKPRQPLKLPGGFSQFLTLLGRRWRVALRDFRTLARQFALLFGFPCALAFFATGDLARLQELSEELRGNVAEQLRDDAVFAVHASHGVGLVAGLAMAQVLLLALMASNNAAQEVAGERMNLEREKHRGLRAGAYVASKVAFLLPWVLLQSAWMAFYVKSVCRLPGDLGMQIAVLALINAALTALCLAVSSLVRTAARSVPICFCLALLQLPLSGTVLAPPDSLSWVARPLATLYWGASAYLQSMQGTRFYDALVVVTPLTLSPVALCLAILGSQIVLGLLFTMAGCKIVRFGVAWKPLGT